MFKSIRLPFLAADDGSMGGGVSGDGSVSSNSEAFTPGWGIPNDVGNQAAEKPANPLLGQQQQPQQEQSPVFDFAGRKIEVSDPAMLSVLKDIHKDYSAMNSTYTQTNQRVKELETANQTYLNLLQNVQQPQSAEPAPSQDQVSEEDMEQMRSDFMEQFYDDPKKAIEGMLENLFEQKVQPVIEPISQERQWNVEVQTMEGKYEDFREMVGPMQQLLQDMPELAQHGLESVYHFAKRTAPSALAPDQLLNDANFRQQLLQNPEVQKVVVSHYLQNRQDMNQQIPVVMGGQPGGQAPAVPEARPKDIRSASKAFLRQLGL